MFIGVWDRCSRMGGGYGTFIGEVIAHMHGGSPGLNF